MISREEKPNNEVLVEQYLAGDRQAQQDMLNLVLPIFHKEAAYVTRGLLSHYGSDELVSDLWLAFLANDAVILSRWKPEMGRPLREYLKAWARFRSRDIIREQARSGLISLSDPKVQAVVENTLNIDNQVNIASEKIDYEKLLSILGDELSLVDQQLLIQLFIEEKPVSEIAMKLGISDAALYQRTSRLRRYIREVFSRYYSAKDDL